MRLETKVKLVLALLGIVALSMVGLFIASIVDETRVQAAHDEAIAGCVEEIRLEVGAGANGTILSGPSCAIPHSVSSGSGRRAGRVSRIEVNVTNLDVANGTVTVPHFLVADAEGFSRTCSAPHEPGGELGGFFDAGREQGTFAVCGRRWDESALKRLGETVTFRCTVEGHDETLTVQLVDEEALYLSPYSIALYALMLSVSLSVVYGFWRLARRARTRGPKGPELPRQ